jgi:hypothetical protein
MNPLDETCRGEAISATKFTAAGTGGFPAFGETRAIFAFTSGKPTAKQVFSVALRGSLQAVFGEDGPLEGATMAVSAQAPKEVGSPALPHSKRDAKEAAWNGWISALWLFCGGDRIMELRAWWNWRRIASFRFA